MEEQTSQEYLDSLKEQIGSMEPMEKACATVLVQLGRIIAELLNLRDWGTIAEMEAVCSDLFVQAGKVKGETIETVQ
ncbi:hypothetical protein ACFL4N_03925 [Thermodesulfobacteriota bacterium]